MPKTKYGIVDTLWEVTDDWDTGCILSVGRGESQILTLVNSPQIDIHELVLTREDRRRLYEVLRKEFDETSAGLD